MKVIIHKKLVDHIPLLEYYLEDQEYKGLVFVQHGYQSNKEYGADYLALPLARKGYFVIAIDAYKHGERVEEPYVTGSEEERLEEAFVVVKRTAIDIQRLHHNHYRRRFPMFDMIGVSLGGMVAYYLATKTTCIRKLIPVISTPDFHQQAYHAVAGAGIDVDAFFTEDKLEFINSINPLNRLDKMTYQSLHVFVAKQDPVVIPAPSLAFFEEQHDEADTIAVFDTDHNVPRGMQKVIFEAVEKPMKKGNA